MFKSLNDLTETNLNMSYNNSQQLSSINSQLNTPFVFSKNDVQLDYLTGQKTLVVQNRILRNCVIKCPNGQIWTGLDYKIHQKVSNEDISKTIFNFTYIEDDQWQDGNYYIYSGMADKGVRLYNAESSSGVRLLNINGQDYILKKLVAGNGINFRVNTDQIMIQLGQCPCYSNPQSLDNSGIIDIYKGDFQIFYTYSNSNIVDLIDTFSEQSSSSSSDSSYNSEYQKVLYVTILLYKPNETIISYKNNIILNKYDVGWFSFNIKKIFGSLFIGQPTRIITDYKIEL